MIYLKKIVMVLFLTITFMLAVVIISFRQPMLPDPLLGYEAWLPGNSEAHTAGFVCQRDLLAEDNFYCARALTDLIWSGLAVYGENGLITRTTFAARSNLVRGQVWLWWANPQTGQLPSSMSILPRRGTAFTSIIRVILTVN